MFRNFQIIEFQNYIWNHHGKCIQISTNMPGIGLVVREIAFEFGIILRKQTRFCFISETNGRVLSVNAFLLRKYFGTYEP